MTQFRTRGKGPNRKVYPVSKRIPYGEARKTAVAEVLRIREKGERARLIETNRRLKLYAPYESILKGGKILSVTRTPNAPKVMSIKRTSQTSAEKSEMPSAPAIEVKKAPPVPKTPDSEIEDNVDTSSEAWAKFLEELKNRPKQKVFRSSEETRRAHKRENYDKLVREIGKIRGKAIIGEDANNTFELVPLNVKITAHPGGESADFYNGKTYMMSLGFGLEKGQRSLHDIYFASVNPDFLKGEKAYLAKAAVAQNDGTVRVSMTEQKWQDITKWIDENIDFKKLVKPQTGTTWRKMTKEEREKYVHGGKEAINE